MLTAFSETAMIQQAVNAAVMGYLVKPIEEYKLGPTINLAVTRFQEMRSTAAEVQQLKVRLEGRDLIDRAKYRLMQQGMSENEAYHYLQGGARRRQISLAEMARRILKQLN
jgi:response regulator NasT